MAAGRLDETLDESTLGSALPGAATPGATWETRPFACAVRIEVAGQSVDDAVEQGAAVVREVQANFVRGPVPTSAKKLRPGAQHFVMWENLGMHSLRLQPNKSNCIVWLSKASAAQSELEPTSSWPAQRALLTRVLPHAPSWVRVLQAARDDGGIDIKDDCRLDDRSAKCHQDGGNAMKRREMQPLLRLAINCSSRRSGRSLDYLEMSTNGRFVNGAERAAALVYSVSQDEMWHGAAQTTAGYIEGVSLVCHGSSAGAGPCLKRIITVFGLPDTHPLARLTAVQRLERVGITVFALDARHQRLQPVAALAPSPAPAPSSAPPSSAPPPPAAPPPPPTGATAQQAVLRSSAHRATWSRSRKADPGPAVPHAALPAALLRESVVRFDPSTHDLRGSVLAMLERASESVGCFGTTATAATWPRRLEEFRVPVRALCGSGGSCEPPQLELANLVAGDRAFLDAFSRLVEGVVLPQLKQRLDAARTRSCAPDGPGESAAAAPPPTLFYYQLPPTLRLQPGRSTRTVRRHTDAEYGHQAGELNYWMPLTDPQLTQTTLWAESHAGGDDFHPLQVGHGEIACFHGSVCRHYVPANESEWTRVSLDFRVGIDGYFDASWSMKGTKADHDRRRVSVAASGEILRYDSRCDGEHDDG